MSKDASTREPAGVDHEVADEAAELVSEADGLLAAAFDPGRWPQARSVDKFLSSGHLESVLSLYARAMRLDPLEPAYPWNLGSTMNRLGLNHLALGPISRAIQLSFEQGDGEWAGADAYLALAEIAVDAGAHDLALTALAHARDLDADGSRDRPIQLLLTELQDASGVEHPEAELASLLGRLPV